MHVFHFSAGSHGALSQTSRTRAIYCFPVAFVTCLICLHSRVHKVRDKVDVRIVETDKSGQDLNSNPF